MRQQAFVAGGLVCLALAACGGGESTSSSGTGGSGAGSGTGGGAATGTGGGGDTGTGGSTTGTGGSGTGGGMAASKWVDGYYVGYQQGLYPPDVIEWSGLTHLMIGRVTPNGDGSLNTTFDIDEVNGPELAKTLSQAAHDNGKKAIVMLGGAGEHDNFAAAASPANRATFVQNLVALANEYGFDGFDLDWEPVEQADQPNLKALAEELRAALPNTVLTIPVGWVNANFPDVEPFYADLAKLVDQMNIMSYGMAGPWDGWQSWHSSALHGGMGATPSSVDVSVKAYIDAGVPAAKLGIGIGFYGSCWSPPVTAPGQALNGATIIADDNAMSFTNIMTDYYVQANRQWDMTARAPYLSFPGEHGPLGCTFISYEDEQSILEKGAYVKQEGLGGAIIWTINQGFLPAAPEGQQNPLLKATAQGFLQ